MTKWLLWLFYIYKVETIIGVCFIIISNVNDENLHFWHDNLLYIVLAVCHSICLSYRQSFVCFVNGGSQLDCLSLIMKLEWNVHETECNSGLETVWRNGQVVIRLLDDPPKINIFTSSYNVWNWSFKHCLYCLYVSVCILSNTTRARINHSFAAHQSVSH